MRKERSLSEKEIKLILDKTIEKIRERVFGNVYMSIDRDCNMQVVDCCFTIRGPKGFTFYLNMTRENIENAAICILDSMERKVVFITEEEIVKYASESLAISVVSEYSRKIVRMFFKGENVWKFGGIERER